MVVHQRRWSSVLCVMLGCSILSISSAEEKDTKKTPATTTTHNATPPAHVNNPSGGANGGGNSGGNGSAHAATSYTQQHNNVTVPSGNVTPNVSHGNATTNNTQRTVNGTGAATTFHPNTGATSTNTTQNYAPKTTGTGNGYAAHGSPGSTGLNNTAHPGNGTGAATTYNAHPNTTVVNQGLGKGTATTNSTVHGNATLQSTTHPLGNGTATTSSTAHGTTGVQNAGKTLGLPATGGSNGGGQGAGKTLGNTGATASGTGSGVPTASKTLNFGNTPRVGGTAGTGLPTAGKTVYTPPSGAAIASKTGNAAVLTHAGSQTVISQVNTARGGMQGINARPLPAGEVTAHPNGALTLKTTNAQYNVRPNGTIASYAAHGQEASFHPNGALSSVHTANMDIHRSPNGQRLVFGHQPDHSLLVNTGYHSGYLERGVAFGGHSYLRRDYVYGHDHFSSFYSPYHYHGLLFAAFVATAIYVPAYYAWAYHPWGAPVAYHWGWVGSPWYGYYGGSYFSPYETYPSAAGWLTDYTLASTLEVGYDERPEAYADSDGGGGLGVVYDNPPEDTLVATAPTPISPELKDAIAQEVSRQLALQQQAAAAPNPDLSQVSNLQNALVPNQVFVVADSLDASTPDQRSCGLTAGDILRLSAVPSGNDQTASLTVASGKRGDCPAGTEVQLSLQNLQDMQNNLSAKIDAGLAALQKDQGNNGLPPAPADALAPPKPGVPAAPDDGAADVQSLLDAQWQQANKTETQIKVDVTTG